MRWLLALVGVAALVGCGDDEPASSSSSFEGIPWVLETGPSATFSDGRVSGSAGCNTFTASYTQDGSALEIDAIATTLMGCPPPADKLEREYVDALERVAQWRVEGDELVLADGDGEELLRFREASPLGAWDATSFLQRDAVASPMPGTEVTAEFDDEGRLTGSAGCNTYRASYEIDGSKITIGEPAATRKACTKPPGIMEQERAYLSALPRAASYTVEGSRLSLLTGEGTFVATYERAR